MRVPADVNRGPLHQRQAINPLSPRKDSLINTNKKKFLALLLDQNPYVALHGLATIK
jgi:hypothetical protein